MKFKVKKLSGDEVKTEVGLLYGSPDGSFSVELDTLEELIDFMKEQGTDLILSNSTSILYNDILPIIKIYDDYNE